MTPEIASFVKELREHANTVEGRLSEKTARRQLIFAADTIEALAALARAAAVTTQDRNPHVGAFEGYLTARARQLAEERGANKLSAAGEAYAGLYACAAMIDVFAVSVPEDDEVQTIAALMTMLCRRVIVVK